MSRTITVTLSIDPNNSANNTARYDPNNQVCHGDSVKFKVEGSTAVFNVSFPDGSPFGASLDNIQVGGTTAAAQQSPDETVESVPYQDYRFTATPVNTPPGPGGQYDTPGTVAGDLEVVKDPPTPPEDRR